MLKLAILIGSALALGALAMWDISFAPPSQTQSNPAAVDNYIDPNEMMRRASNLPVEQYEAH
jgi:hypothetical protein